MSEPTQEKIIEGASALFWNLGVKSVTMDDVATELGISKRTIYEQFSGKRELLEACIERMHREHLAMEDQMIASSNNIVEELFSILRANEQVRHSMFRFVMDLKKYYPELFKQQTCTQNEVASARLRKRLVRGIEQGIIVPDTDVELSVFVVSETMRAMIMRADQLNPSAVDVTQAFRYIFVSFFRGIATAKGIEMIDQAIKQNKQ